MGGFTVTTGGDGVVGCFTWSNITPTASNGAVSFDVTDGVVQSPNRCEVVLKMNELNVLRAVTALPFTVVYQV